MALIADLDRKNHNKGEYAVRATNAVQFYQGSLVGIDISTGLAVKWADTANFRFLGVSKTKVLGDTTAANPPELRIDGQGIILDSVAVVGVTAITDQGELVYATDDNTFTLTPTSNVNAIGWIVRRISGTSCDVQLFTPNQYRAFVAA